MQTERKKAEETSELSEIYGKLQTQGKRLAECISRISRISDKLENRAELVEESKNPSLAPYSPGITNDFNNCAEGFRDYISQIEGHLYKIEKHI